MYASRNKKQYVNKFVGYSAVALVLCASLFLIRSLLLDSFGWLHYSSQSASLAWKSLVGDKQELLETIDLLNEEVLALRAERVLTGSLHRELQNLLEETSLEESGGVVAPVVARPPYTLYDTYLVKGGSEAGFSEGNLVTSKSVHSVGYIKEVAQDFSVVELFSYPESEHVVSVDGILYKAVGKGGGVLEVQLPRSYRDSGFESVYVPGVTDYVIGVIHEKRFDPQDSFVRALVLVGDGIFTNQFVTVTPRAYTVDLESVIEEFEDEEEVSSTP